MACGCSSKLMAATPPALTTAFRPIGSAQCLRSKHMLLAFVRQSDVKTTEPSLFRQNLVLRSTRLDLLSARSRANVVLGDSICESPELARR